MSDIELNKPTQKTFLDDWWPCACVKRDAEGRMSHIKGNHPSVNKCRRCGCTKEQHDRLAKVKR